MRSKNWFSQKSWNFSRKCFARSLPEFVFNPHAVGDGNFKWCNQYIKKIELFRGFFKASKTVVVEIFIQQIKLYKFSFTFFSKIKMMKDFHKKILQITILKGFDPWYLKDEDSQVLLTWLLKKLNPYAVGMNSCLRFSSNFFLDKIFIADKFQN